MSKNIVDLRNLNKRENTPTKIPSLSSVSPGEDKPNNNKTNQGPPAGDKEIIRWQANEYEPKKHGQYWFLSVGVATTLLAIFGILIRSYFFVSFIALAFMVTVMYAQRKPSRVSFAISEEGIKVGRRFYGFSELKSFWVFEEKDGKDLSLETNKTLFPFVRFPLGGVETEKVRRTIGKFIPEKEHQEVITDQIARNIGF